MSRLKKGLVNRVMAVILSGAMTMSNMTAFASETSEDTGGGYSNSESVSECTAEFTEEEIGTQIDSDGEEIKTEPVTEEAKEVVAEEQDNETEQDSAESAVEEEVLESSSENGVQQEEEQPAVQADTPVSGTDWTLGTDGKLTITSDAGMTDWIGKAADNKAQVKTMEIQTNVTKIGKNAFKGCSGLTSITIQGNVTAIEDYAFNGCSGLTDITIPNSVTSIGRSAFEGCSGLTSIVIPDSVTKMDIYTFKNCTSLTSVKISENVKSLGMTFMGCSSLKSVTIPKNVKSIGGGTFNGCSSLESVTIEGKLEGIQGNVFKNCTSLTSITIPYAETGVQEFNLGPYAFDGCKNLTSVTFLPSGIKTHIGNYAFQNCSSLQSIDLPEHTTGLGTYSFSGCSSLESITIPSEVTGIGANAFENCTSLTSVTMQSTTPPGLDNNVMADGNPQEVFKGCKFVTDNVKGKGIYVPLGTAKTYQEEWPAWAYYIEPKLDITTQPEAPKDVQNGQSVTFSVAAEGDGTINYQWQVDKKDGNGFVNLDGANSTTYAIDAVDKTIHNGYTYRCVVTSETGEITSNEVVLNVRDSDAEKIAKAKPIAKKVLDDFIATNGTTEESFRYNIREALVKEGIRDVGNKAEITKIQATMETEGSVKGTLTLTCGGAKDTLVIDMVIAKLTSKVEAAKKVVEDTLAALPLSNATTHASIQNDINEALKKEKLTDVTATVKGIAREEATIRDKGFISFEVEIKSAGEETTTIGPKTLWLKLPDSERIAAAKQIVKDTLEEFTATNDTTKEDIQAAIDKAIRNELVGVPVTVGEITKTNATTEATGSVSGSMTITCEETTDTVSFNKEIAKLSKVEIAERVVKDTYQKLRLTVTCDTTIEDIQSAIDEALAKEEGLNGVTATVELIKRIEPTVSRDGYIEFKVKIECAPEASKTIGPKILWISAPATEKVAAVKKVVNDTLEGLTVTNDTTKADIQSAIDKAIDKEEIDYVTVTVGELTKTEATTKAPGSITGTVTITCKDVTDTVEINKVIEKLTSKAEAAKKVVNDILDGLTATNDTTKADIQNAINKALNDAGITDVTVTVGELTKTEATIDATGSISGTVTIVCGSETDTVEVSKTIAKLSKAEAAKKTVNDTLDGLTVTNDTTKEDIQNAINKALNDAGITDVTVTVGDITKTKATTDATGSITGTVTIVCGSETDSVPISKTIAKLSETSDDENKEKAKEIIEGALKKITITNDTTQDDILDALKEALGDDATVEGIKVADKIDATEEAPGSLSLEITVTIDGKQVIIDIIVPIKKVEATEKRTGVWVRFTDYDTLKESSKPCYKYTGTAIKPEVEVYHNAELLTIGSDYTISYKNNTKVGSASLTVKGKGNYSGNSNVVDFTIIKANIKDDTDHPTEMTVVAGTKVAPVIMNGTKQLTAKDYELTGAGLDMGKYAAATAADAFNTLTVKGIGSYEGSFDIKVKVIDKNAAKKLAVTVDKGFKPVYDGKALNMTTLFKGANNPNGMITVTDSKEKGKVLELGQHFTVVCASNLKNAGTVKFTLTGMGEYAGSVSKTFKISPLKVTDGNKFAVTFEEKVYEYKASGTVVDKLAVKYLGETASDTDDQILRQGVDYKVSYSNNKKVSDSKEAQLKITFLGNYKGSAPVSKSFKINVAKMSAKNTVVTVPDMVYSKADKAYKSTPIVTVDGAAIKASDYDVSYKWATGSKADNDAEYVSDDQVKITIAEGDSYAKVKVTITPKGSYVLAEGAAIEGEYYVRKAEGAVDLSKAKVTFHDKAGNQLKNLEYTGAAFYTPEGNNPKAENAPDDANAVYVSVTVKGEKVAQELYDVTWTNATAKGKATVVIRGKGVTTSTSNVIAVGSKNQSINIKAMVLKGKDLKTVMEKAVKNLKNMFL